MKIHQDGSSVVVTGKGMVLLKAKAALASLLPEDEIRHLNKTQVAFPRDKLHLVESALARLGADVPQDMLDVVEDHRKSVAGHLEAKRAIASNIENSMCLTGDPFWDKTLDPKQGLAVNCMVTPGLLGMCLFDEQGAGKTVMTMAAFDIQCSRGDIDALWVVCPKSMVGEWPKEFSSFLGSKYSVSILEGDAERRMETIRSRSDVLVSNFEGIRSHVELLKGIASVKKVALVVDESFYVKNVDAARSQAIASVRNSCAVAYCLCGTPAPNKPEDIIHQFDVADGGYTFEGFRIPQLDVEVVDAVTRRIEERGVWLRRLKEELLPDLPEKAFNLYSVPLVGRQAMLYDKARDELLLYLRNLDNTRFKKELGTYFQKRAALMQICVDPSAIDPSYNEVPAKYSKLDALLSSIVEDSGRKVVLWSFYKKSLDALAERYSKYGVVRVDGTVSSSKERRRAVAEFQTNSNVHVFIGNPAAAGAGITLHAASDAVYVSYSNQAAHYLQSLDRIHRRGQLADEVNYHLLVCRGTIEEREMSRLRDKERRQSDLLGDVVKWPNSLDDALAELGGVI